MSIDRKNEFEMLMEAFSKEGGDAESIKKNLGASMVLNKDEVIHANQTEAIKMNYEKIENGIKAHIIVKEGSREKRPVHLCFGMLPKEGKQVIDSTITVEKNAKVKIISHCIFPNAINIQHIMKGNVIIQEGGSLEYEEEHYHSEDGGITVVPKIDCVVEKDGRFFNNFIMKHGRVGELKIDYKVSLKENATAELVTKVAGKKDDKIETVERISLEGKGAKGLIKARIVLRDESTSKFVGTTEAFAPNTRAHVDCNEVIMDKATASAIPEIISHEPSARLTHEAAIGRIDQKQLLTLMAKGLSEERATEIIVKGILS